VTTALHPETSQTIPTTMRAAVLVAPGEFRILEKRVPEPGHGEVLVKVAMCGTCGTDLKIQHHPFPNQPPFGEFTPGHEWTGTVVALGPTVDEFAVGDRVAIEAHSGCMRCENCVVGMYTACLNYGNVAKGHRTSGFTTDGGFAEYVVHHINALYKLPDNVSWEDAVLVTTAGTGLYGLDTAGGFIVGQSVVIIGPGPVGLMTVQLCKALGAGQTIYGVAGHMHLRGQEITVTLDPGTAKEQTLLHIPAWDFHWQDVYYLQTPIKVGATDTVRVRCTFDNSAADQPVVGANRLAPRYVLWGEGTTDEMCLAMLSVATG